jgi:ribonuclease PH
VYKPNGSNSRFVALKDGGGLYRRDTNVQTESSHQEKSSRHGMVMVKDNKNKFSTHEMKRVELARKVKDSIGRPSMQQYMIIILNNLLPNCTVTTTDIKMTECIFVSKLGTLKGRMTKG